jgi:hypothetical protein
MLQLKKKTSIIVMTLIASAAIVSVFITFEQPRATLAQTSDGEDDLCGKTVTQSITLSNDLKCSGDGIRVQGSNIIIDLNGFTLRGPGANSNTTGISVDGAREVRIKGPGMVLSFGTGIRYTDASGGTIRDIQVGFNDVGFNIVASEETQMKQLYIHNNRVGVIDAAHNSEVEGVQLNSNDLAVHATSSSKGIDIDFNIIMDGKSGIQVDPGIQGAEVFYNTIFRQQGLDMQLPSPLKGVLLGNNDCTTSDPAQYCQIANITSQRVINDTQQNPKLSSDNNAGTTSNNSDSSDNNGFRSGENNG